MARETIFDDEDSATITLPGNVALGPAQTMETVGATLTLLTGYGAGRFFFVGPEGATLGRGDGATVGFSDPSVSRLHAHIEMMDGVFHIADLGSSNGTFVNELPAIEPTLLQANCRIRLGGKTILEFAAVDQLGSRAFEQLSQALLIDPLTGTGNRFHLERRLREEVSFAHRRDEPLGVLLLDLDFFKNVNDDYGHLTGDAVLREVGRILLATVRIEDSVFRYGGEEFCILVRGVPDEGLIRMAERVRVAVEGLSVPIEGGEEGHVKVTVSIGIAAIENEEGGTEETIILRADQALYEAKEQGRNRAVMAPKTID